MKRIFKKKVFYLNPTHNCCSVSLHGSEVECWADYNKRIIPIIIGAAVVCLILISLMSFLVVRDRRRDGYERIWMAKSSLWNWTGGGGGGCYWLVHTLALSLVLFLNLHLACHILLLTAKTVCLVFTIWINKTFFKCCLSFFFFVVAFINVLCNFNWYFFSLHVQYSFETNIVHNLRVEYF